jgi:hypothetical protein
MSAFLDVCRIETLKLRRTLALWMTLVAPAAVILLQLLIVTRVGDGPGADIDIWLSFQKNALTMWALFMQPLFVALVYHLEHASNGWLRLFVLPVPRWTIPAAKLGAVLGLVTLATIALFVLAVAATWMAPALNAKVELPAEIPWGELVWRAGRVFVATLAVVAIQNFVSFRFASVPLSLGVGIVGTFVGLFASSWKGGPYFPWLMGLHAIHGKEAIAARIMWMAPLLAVLVAGATIVYASRRDPAAGA